MITEEYTRDPMRTRTPPQHDGETIANLLKHLRDQLVALFRQEVALAKTETAETARHAGRQLASIAIGAGIAMAGLVVLLIGAADGAAVALAAAGLEAEIAVWLGPVLLGAIVAVIGLAFLQKGKSGLRNLSLTPKRTVRTLKEDQSWAKQKIQQS